MFTFSITGNPPTAKEISKERRILNIKSIISTILTVSSLILFLFFSHKTVNTHHIIGESMDTYFIKVNIFGVLSAVVLFSSAIILDNYGRKYFSLDTVLDLYIDNITSLCNTHKEAAEYYNKVTKLHRKLTKYEYEGIVDYVDSKEKQDRLVEKEKTILPNKFLRRINI